MSVSVNSYDSFCIGKTMTFDLCFLPASVFQKRDGSWVKNLIATATWLDTDENHNKLRYSYKLEDYT